MRADTDKRAIAKQIVLPWSTSFRISFKNLKVRFFRSMITVASLILAVSFLAFVLVNQDTAQSVTRSLGQESVPILTEAGYEVDPDTLQISIGPKERWILVLSLVVCTVGIINAQLMSVTERFREIGIMKCLGALDRIVLRLFLLEAMMQGLAGAGIGAFLGLVFALLAAMARYGLSPLGAISAVDVSVSVLQAVSIGCLLSLLGVLYPALVAARMRPVVAMKTEL